MLFVDAVFLCFCIGIIIFTTHVICLVFMCSIRQTKQINCIKIQATLSILNRCPFSLTHSRVSDMSSIIFNTFPCKQHHRVITCFLKQRTELMYSTTNIAK